MPRPRMGKVLAVQDTLQRALAARGSTLRNFRDAHGMAGSFQQQAKIEFDRLLGTQSYRQIFTDRARFIAATVDDP